MSTTIARIQPKGDGATLVGIPNELIAMMIKSTANQNQVRKEIVTEGPDHKKVLTALLLDRVTEMIKTVEAKTKTEFKPQFGFEVQLQDEEKTFLPLSFPIHHSSQVNTKKIVETIAHAPEHEILAYGMALQAIDWVIQTLKSRNA